MSAIAVGAIIAGAGLFSLWADFNPPDLQLLRQAAPCTPQGIATGANCVQTVLGHVVSASRGGAFLQPKATIEVSAGDRDASLVLGIDESVALPTAGASVPVRMWRSRMVALELAGNWYSTAEVPEPITDNIGVVVFSAAFAVAIIYFAIRLLTGRAESFDYFG